MHCLLCSSFIKFFPLTKKELRQFFTHVLYGVEYIPYSSKHSSEHIFISFVVIAESSIFVVF